MTLNNQTLNNRTQQIEQTGAEIKVIEQKQLNN
jgi:hypothetical protein